MTTACVQRTPQHHFVTIDEVSAVAAGLARHWARSMTGNTVFVDGGSHIMG